jgi:hypothetical protein
MQQTTTGVAVVTTQLAWTDRRALSEAWYSALHLAEHDLPRNRPRSGSPGGVRYASPVRADGSVHAARSRAVAEGAAQRPRRSTDRREPKPSFAPRPSERRCERAVLAARAGRVPYRATPPSAAQSFVVRCAGGRVQLFVRHDRDRTRVVALCSPSLRERVERALARARYTLAARSIRAEAA